MGAFPLWGREVDWDGGEPLPEEQGEFEGVRAGREVFGSRAWQGWSVSWRGGAGGGRRAVVVSVQDVCGRAGQQGGSRAGARDRATGLS